MSRSSRKIGFRDTLTMVRMPAQTRTKRLLFYLPLCGFFILLASITLLRVGLAASQGLVVQDQGQQTKAKEAIENLKEKIEALNSKSTEELLRDLEHDPGSVPVVRRLRMLDDARAIEPLKTAFAYEGF